MRCARIAGSDAPARIFLKLFRSESFEFESFSSGDVFFFPHLHMYIQYTWSLTPLDQILSFLFSLNFC